MAHLALLRWNAPVQVALLMPVELVAILAHLALQEVLLRVIARVQGVQNASAHDHETGVG